MHKAMRLAIVAVTLVTLVVLTVAASALAVTSSDTQSSPGTHQRTIWDSTQVMIQPLTKDGSPGVNHLGYIHLELKFKPTTSDLDLYLLDSQGNVLSEEMGCMGVFAGKEFVDYQVTAVDNQDIEIEIYEDDFVEYMVGDVYYVVIVAFNGTAEYQVWGYYPQIDLDTSYDVEESYDFRPTSAGVGTCRLEWPADVLSKTVTYDRALAPMPFNVEQYLYAGDYWDEVLSNWGTSENYLPDLWTGDDVVDPADDWYGFNDEFDVAENAWDDVLWAQRPAHYVPSLFLAYANPLLGPEGGVKTGLSKMGYKAVLRYPENLWLKKVTKYSTYYTVAGRYALDGVAVPIGTKIEIQRKTATKGWATITTVKTTSDLGAWSVKERLTEATAS